MRIKIALLVIFSSGLLAGCVPAVLVTTGTAIGVWFSDQRAAKTIISDHKMALMIENKLKKNKIIYRTSHVSITVFNQIALLVGQAPNEDLHQIIVNTVKAFSGLRLLYDEIKVKNPITEKERKEDAWITAKIKSQLFTIPGLNASNIKIVTEDRVVYVMGIIGRAQGEIATKAIQQVNGVQKIVKLFEHN